MSHEQLLEIQQIDVETDQLNHRRISLPQRAELESARRDRQVQQVTIDEVAALRVEAATRQRRLEDEAETVSAKVDQDQARLYNGEVTAMKDLQALQAEIAHLRERQESIEDDALVSMEEAERLSGQVSAMEDSCSGLDERIARLVGEIADSEDEIDTQLAALTEQRATCVTEVDAALLEDYAQLRPGFGSATVIRFDGRNCSGCPSTMPAVEVDRLKHVPSGTLDHCNECGRIVVT